MPKRVDANHIGVVWTCEWSYDDIDDYYQTGCDKSFVLTDGTLDDSGFRYCPYCGRPISEVNDAKTG